MFAWTDAARPAERMRHVCILCGVLCYKSSSYKIDMDDTSTVGVNTVYQETIQQIA